MDKSLEEILSLLIMQICAQISCNNRSFDGFGCMIYKLQDLDLLESMLMQGDISKYTNVCNSNLCIGAAEMILFQRKQVIYKIKMSKRKKLFLQS